MRVAALVPYRPGCPHRERAWTWVEAEYAAAGIPVVIGTSTTDEFSRTQAILDARRHTTADVLIVADADVWCDDLDEIVALAGVHGWAIPNRLHRLSPASTLKVLAGASWRGLPLSTDNDQDSRPYLVHAAGTLLALTADTFDLAPPDPRFVGWGQEDDAWARALRTLVGNPRRAKADVVHLWHPPQPRLTRRVGNSGNRRLLARYLSVRHDRARMLALLEEVRP